MLKRPCVLTTFDNKSRKYNLLKSESTNIQLRNQKVKQMNTTNKKWRKNKIDCDITDSTFRNSN